MQYQEVSNVELSTSVLADVKVDPEQKEVELHLSKEKIQVTDNSTISVDKKGNVQVAEIEIKSIDRKQRLSLAGSHGYSVVQTSSQASDSSK